MTNNKHTATEIKIKTPYGIKNWSYLKRLMDNDVKAVNSHDKLVSWAKKMLKDIKDHENELPSIRAFCELWAEGYNLVKQAEI